MNLKRKSDKMPAKEFSELHSFLVKKGVVDKAEMEGTIGNRAGRREEVVEKLRAWLKASPKAKIPV